MSPISEISGELLKMQIIVPYPRTSETKSLGTELKSLLFQKITQVSFM